MEKHWFLIKIPKILHIYYGGKISYLNYLTIVSFLKHNPDWTVMFYYPEFYTHKISWTSFEQKYEQKFTDYMNKVMKLPIIKTAIDFKDYNISNKISEVHKSDFIRWKVLSSIGGLWSDMDILYFKPITALFINRQEYWYMDTVVSISDYGHSIGFMMASYDNEYYKKLSENSEKAYQKESYQCMGSALCNRLFPKIINIPGYPVNIGMDAVYHFDANNIEKIYKHDLPLVSKKNTIGIHWYAGHPLAGQFLNKTNGGLTDLPNNTLSRIIKIYNKEND